MIAKSLIRDATQVAVFHVQKIEELIEKKIHALYATLLPEGARDDAFLRVLVMLHAQSWKLLLSMEFSRAKVAHNKVVRMGARRDVDSSRIRIIDMILLNSFEQDYGRFVNVALPRRSTVSSKSYNFVDSSSIDLPEKHIWVSNRSCEARNDARSLMDQINGTWHLMQLLGRNDFFCFFYDSLFVISTFIERGEEMNAAVCRTLLIKTFDRLSSYQLETKKIEDLIDFATPLQKAILNSKRTKDIRYGRLKDSAGIYA